MQHHLFGLHHGLFDHIAMATLFKTATFFLQEFVNDKPIERDMKLICEKNTEKIDLLATSCCQVVVLGQ